SRSRRSAPRGRETPRGSIPTAARFRRGSRASATRRAAGWRGRLFSMSLPCWLPHLFRSNVVEDRDHPAGAADRLVHRLVFLVREPAVALEPDLAFLGIGLAREQVAQAVLQFVGGLDGLAFEEAFSCFVHREGH